MRDMSHTSSYDATRTRVADYFDGTATRVWERLTSDAPVSRIRQTVREGRDRMRTMMLAEMPSDLRSARVLDAGCGTGAASAEMAARGADVLAIDISPKLIEIAQARLPQDLQGRIDFRAGDMLSADLGQFDYVIAMDSLIYYTQPDLEAALDGLRARTGQIVFTLAPRTPLLMAMWHTGRIFPRADRSPTMIPHDHRNLNVTGVCHVGRVSRGLYISECLKVRS